MKQLKKTIIVLHIIFSSIAFADGDLQVIAESNQQWTGIAINSGGSIFVNYPRWHQELEMSVAKFIDGEAVPFPDRSWNSWQESEPTNPRKFVAVQSVVADRKDRLWVVDTGNPQFKGVISGFARLISFDSKSGKHLKTYRFPQHVAPLRSYLNDVRIDEKRGFAYLTDSGLGAIVVVNLETGEMKRRLANSSYVKAENIALTVNNKKWLQNGVRPKVHSDGIAYDQAKDEIYFQALTGRHLYSVSAAHLRNAQLTDYELEKLVINKGLVGASDGLLTDSKGQVFLTSLEHNAIRKYSSHRGLETIIQDVRIEWPDSLAFDNAGNIYFTTSRIHLPNNTSGPFRIFKLKKENLSIH